MAKQDDGGDTKNGDNTNGDNPEYENFQQLLRQVLCVPKEDVDKRRREEEREKRAG